MAIQKVDAIAVAYPEPNDSDAKRYLVFCRLETDDGVIGWGEAISQLPESTRATAVVIEGLSDLLVGKDPLQHRAIWDEIIKRSWWYGYEGGPAWFAISAIDVALWDLKGKILGRSVSELIGGAVRSELPVIASTHAFNASLDFEIERYGRGTSPMTTSRGSRWAWASAAKLGSAMSTTGTLPS